MIKFLYLSVFNIYFYCNLLDALTLTDNYDNHARGPNFVMEPPPKLEFSNSSGGWLDCSATGIPQPTISWLTADGQLVGDIMGVRRVLLNGTLYLMPFQAPMYRQDIHNTIYRCVASNIVGQIVSRDVQIRAVVAQEFSVDVEVLTAPLGCTAILRCLIPTFVRELVRVVSWVQDPSIYIYPSLQGDGKYHLMPTGELFIHNLQHSDELHSFRCRSMHKLTRQVVISNPARLRVNGLNPGLYSPNIVEHTTHVSVSQDEGAVLICIAQACPTPAYKWYFNNKIEIVPVQNGQRVRILGSILAIEAVTTDDAGDYKCSASNVAGETSADIRLSVAAPLQIEIQPSILSVNMGALAEFTCKVSSNGIQVNTPHILWFKDGRQLPTGRLEDVLIINRVSRENKGMYQCVARRPEGDTFQATAELKLGDAAPILLYSFIEQTLQPGPAVSLKCSASGNPTPQIIWKLDGFPLPSNGRFVLGHYTTIHGDIISHVNISHVTVEDGGEYDCTAINRAGRNSHSARLNIYGLPYIRLIPKVTAVSGEELSLKCPVAGYPIEEIHWERNGRELPTDIKQKVESDGRLIINSVQKKTDSGIYTCWAKNKQGHSARRSGEVNVIVPPKVNPFSTSTLQLNMGERASLTCSIIKGDMPISLSWRKNGRTIDSSLHMSVKHVDQYNSILVIENLRSEHTGNYSCVVRNLAAEVETSQSILVNVPPRWIVEPSDVSVNRNRNIMINCQAGGVPTPTVIWKKAIGMKAGEFDDLREQIHSKLMANGSLILHHVQEDTEGFYLCQASNGIGNGIGKVISLKVNSSPYFSQSSQSVSVKKGNTAILQCSVNGDKPINIVWMKSGENIVNSVLKERVFIKQDPMSDTLSAELHIKHTESSDSGAYVCRANNAFGHDQQLTQLQVQEPPQAPDVFEVNGVLSNSISLKWIPKTNAVDVSKYIIEYKELNDPYVIKWNTKEVLRISQYSTLIENLKPATKYIFQIIAEGVAGRSSPSKELIVKTEPLRPAGPPLEVSARPISSTEIFVKWKAPLLELRHGDIQGYNIGYSSSSGPTLYNFTSITGDMDDGNGEIILTNLEKFTKYNLIVQAFNEVGPGPLSDPIIIQTMEDIPSHYPEDPRCAALTSQSLQISWQPPPSHLTNGIIQGYKIFYEPMTSAFNNNIVENRKTTALTIVLTGLRKFTNYSIQLSAYTRMGDGILSFPKYCHTEEDVPEPPSDIKSVISSQQSLYISWLPPTDSNGVITKYNLYTRVINGREEINNEKRSFSSEQTTYEAINLHSHIEYQFWVTSSTRVGEGKSSRVISQMTSNRIPARIVSFGGVVYRPWRTSTTLSCLSVGNTKRLWYKVDSLLSKNLLHNMQITDAGDLIISNLQASDNGNYTCNIENSIGADRITYSLFIQVPPSAPVLYVTSATSNTILLQWKQIFDGNSPLTGFMLYYKRSNTNVKELYISRHSSSYELSNLMCGSIYQIYLTAQNDIGTSPSSIILNVRTQGSSPGIPKPTQLLYQNSTFVSINLIEWPDNGCPIQYFIVEYRKVISNSENGWTLVSNSLKSQKKIIINNLIPSTMYQIKIEAHNVAGSSKSEFAFLTLTKDGKRTSHTIVDNGLTKSYLYSNMNIVITLGITILLMFCVCCSFGFGYKYKRSMRSKESLENNHNLETSQRERYYATIHKVALQNNDKIPETSEDISPYATFQLSEVGPLAHQSGPTNTLLHSFMYNERSPTEGCSTTPSVDICKTLISERKSNIYQKISSKNRRRLHIKGLESEESESDLDHSNIEHIDSIKSKPIKSKHDIVYHGTQSSTSSELSPIVEQKSLPRRGRPRYLSENTIYNFSTNTTPRHKASQSIINKSPSKTSSKMQPKLNEINFLQKNSKFRPILSMSSTSKQTSTFET